MIRTTDPHGVENSTTQWDVTNPTSRPCAHVTRRSVHRIRHTLTVAVVAWQSCRVAPFTVKV
jgi:hypothetical protein